MTDAEITRFWGEHSLLRWRSEIVAHTTLPADAKRFLIEVGLPRGIEWEIRFGTEGGQLPEFDGHPGCYVIGAEYPWICIDAATTGHVVAISCMRPPHSRYLVNSNVHLLGEFLVHYQKYRLMVDDFSEKDQQKLVADTKQKMEACDPIALTTPDAFWVSIIEEMSIGWM